MGSLRRAGSPAALGRERPGREAQRPSSRGSAAGGRPIRGSSSGRAASAPQPLSRTAPLQKSSSASLLGRAPSQPSRNQLRCAWGVAKEEESWAHSMPALVASASEPFLTSVAATTKEENRRAAKIEEQLAHHASATGSGFTRPGIAGSKRPDTAGRAGRPGTAGQVGRTNGSGAEPNSAPRTADEDGNFLEDLGRMEATLKECTSRIRMEQFKNANVLASEEGQKRMEEQKRKDDEKERRLREATRTARNPRNRVASRLAHCREFGMTNNCESTVPMRVLVDANPGMREKLEVVDVSFMQSRCVGLDSGEGFNTFMDAADRRDARLQWEAQAYNSGDCNDFIKQNRSLESTVALSRTATSLASRLTQPESKQDFRQAQAKLRRSQMDRARISQKMQATRSSKRAVIACVSMHRSRRGGLNDTLQVREDIQSAMHAAGMDVRMSMWRSRYLWRVLRSAFRVVCLLHLIRKKHRSAETLFVVCTAIAEQKQLQNSIKRLLRRVTQLQRFCRDFFKRRKLWCERATKLWTQLEDHYLQAFFRTERRSGGEEDMSQPLARTPTSPQSPLARPPSAQVRTKSAHRQSLQQFESFSNSRRPAFAGVEWKTLRIPQQMRYHILCRWHRSQLQVSAQRADAWSGVLDNALANDRDLKNYLKSCETALSGRKAAMSGGRRLSVTRRCSVRYADTIQPQKNSRSASFVPAVPGLYLLGEEQILELIAQGAREAIVQSPHFGEHPVNRGLGSRGRSKARASRVPSAWLADPVTKAMNSKTSHLSHTTDCPSQRKSQSSADVEAVLLRPFTPSVISADELARERAASDMPEPVEASGFELPAGSPRGDGQSPRGYPGSRAESRAGSPMSRRASQLLDFLVLAGDNDTTGSM